MSVLEKWAQHRTTDHADDNVAQRGSLAICFLLTEGYKGIRTPWLAAGAERVLRGIIADTSEATDWAKSLARDALRQLGL